MTERKKGSRSKVAPAASNPGKSRPPKSRSAKSRLSKSRPNKKQGRGKPQKASAKHASSSSQGRFWRWCRRLMLAGIVCGLVATLAIDFVVRSKFEGKKWALPARVYAQPLELYQGLALKAAVLDAELEALGYSPVQTVTKPGQFEKKLQPAVAGSSVLRYRIHSRDFTFWDKREPPISFELELRDQVVTRVRDLEGRSLDLLRLEPREIGGIYPAHMEDRLLVKLSEIPPLLGETLIAIEDKNFLDHFGISPKAIARAALANLKAGGVVQGGSTLTQQLVKNFYLNQQRSLTRKALEAVMSVLLELHYSKSQILEAYLNEVYLGQSGPRGVHGFALASQHYFKQPLQELETEQIALLVGLVKGASYYNPWRYPERAKKRRDLVLRVMQEAGLISAAEREQATVSPLSLVSAKQRSLHAHPAFMDLVKRQLRRDYEEDDLRSEGLRIFTSLSPSVQAQAEAALARQLERLERGYNLTEGGLQGAAVIAAVGSAEVLAVVGDRNSQFAGFNRALDARRPIGSLIKPAVFLTALEGDGGHHLASEVSDAPVTVAGRDGSFWQPRNFSRENHGDVLLYRALASSYNQATARLGMEMGLHQVKATVLASGIEDVNAQLTNAPSGHLFRVPEVPSMLLGSVELSPLAVLSMYHTFAADGFYTPLRVIRAVQTEGKEQLKRYPLQVEQRFSAESVYLLNYALQAVMREGTGKTAYQRLPKSLRVAGKTGTTNDQRDSWFSGFSGDHLAVVWLGRDDNGKTPLTGGTGALKVWTDIMAGLSTRSIESKPPANVTFLWVDSTSGLLSSENCMGAVLMPFVTTGAMPQDKANCQWIENPVLHWWKGLW